MPNAFDDETDAILGITRCARCGQRLDGEMACPVCSGYDASGGSDRFSRTVFLMACFLASPLSLPAIWRSPRLAFWERLFASTGGLFWLALWFRFA